MSPLVATLYVHCMYRRLLLRDDGVVGNSSKAPCRPCPSVFNPTGVLSDFIKEMKMRLQLLPLTAYFNVDSFYQTRLILFSNMRQDHLVPSFSTLFCFLEEFQNFVRRLPTFYALNASAVQYFWKMDPGVHQRFQLLENNIRQLLSKAHRMVSKLFSLSKRCRTQPKISVPRER